jgi:SAM-dependent methyltransferase
MSFSPPEFQPHHVEWTREKSARFWDGMSSHLTIDDNYFSAMVGSSLIRFVQSRGVELSGRVLDFGCGLGDLIGKLIEKGVQAEGVDFSPSSVDRVNHRFKGQPRFASAHVIRAIPTEFPDASFDLHATVAELRRLLRPGGTLIVSTPNEERLNLNEAICPECGCIFHRIQHVRTWTARSLQELMARSGFDCVTVEALYLQDSWWKSRLFRAAARLFGKRLPHLIYIGKAVAGQPG